MQGVLIVDAVRTPFGGRNGALSGWHPAELAARCTAALLARTGLPGDEVDDLLLGCVTWAGAQSFNVARTAALAAGLPLRTPGVTLDRQGASGLSALALGAAAAAAGQLGVAVVGGVEVTSVAPPGASVGVGFGSPFPPAVANRFHAEGGLAPPGPAAELLAARAGLSREALDAYARDSVQRAARAQAEGRFVGQLVALGARRRDPDTGEVREGPGPALDEGVAQSGGRDAAAFAAAKPLYPDGALVTALNAAPLADGAAALLLASASAATRLGLTPRARVAAAAACGADPVTMHAAAAPAARAALASAGCAPGELAGVELDETFAAAALCAMSQLDLDPSAVNRSGGSLALGDPPGATGARLAVNLLAELERSGGRWGLAVAGGAGGVAQAVVLERLP